MIATLYAADRYELSVDGRPLTLAPFPASEADVLAAGFAAIDPWASYGYPAAALAAYLSGDEPTGVRFALLFDGGIAGAVGLQSSWLRGPYIRFLGILPAYQGRGLGAAVLAWIEAEARNAQERNVWVVASQINTGAIRFYERHGFATAAEFEGLAYDGRTEILMRKRLTTSA